MKRRFSSFIATLTLLISPVITVLAQENGEKSFSQICAACHTVGKGRLVGPDLKNVLDRHSEQWLMKFIKSSQSVIKSGDKYADSLFMAFNKVIMPDQPALSDVQIKDILAYIKLTGNTPNATIAAASPASAEQKTGNNDQSSFSILNVILLTLIFFLALVILLLSRTIKSLSEQILDYYSSNRAFFKK